MVLADQRLKIYSNDDLMFVTAARSSYPLQLVFGRGERKQTVEREILIVDTVEGIALTGKIPI